ncbi:MAG TPA: YwaF family protein [Actinotalea sp.]|nr:YwaF family protein [Actinotalea sp.]
MPTAQKGADVDGPTWTWDYFLVPQTVATPAASAMGMFSPLHLGVLAALTAAVAVLVLRYRAADPARRRRLRLGVASALLLVELLRQLGHALTGTYTTEIVPLHVCGISVVIVMIDATRANRWTGDFLYVLGWWGALAADLFPDWAHRPLLNIYTWQAFAAHTLIVGYVLMLLFGGDLVPKVANLGRAAIAMASLGAVAAVANLAWGTNFWFLGTAAPGSPLEPIQAWAGAGYVPVLIVLFVLLTAVLYLPWALAARRGGPALPTELPPPPQTELPASPQADLPASPTTGAELVG